MKDYSKADSGRGGFFPFIFRKGARMHYYQSLLESFYDIKTYAKILEDHERKVSLKTNREIYLSNNLKFGCSYISMKRKFSSPYYQVKFFNPLGIRCQVYRLMLGRYKVKLETHFYKRKLFFFRYVFTGLSNEDKFELMDILYQKYLSVPYSFSLQDIVDPNGNCIHVEDDVSFTIDYFAVKSEFFLAARSFYDNHQKLQVRKLARNSEMLFNSL